MICPDFFFDFGFQNDDFWCNLGVIFTVQLPVLYAVQIKTNDYTSYNVHNILRITALPRLPKIELIRPLTIRSNLTVD